MWLRLNKTILLFLQTRHKYFYYFFLAISLSLCAMSVMAQKEVSFKADDGLSVSADLYLIDKAKPFILLFHQAESSRGEFLEIAPKLNKLGYNCLAVDLRVGSKINYVTNETAKRAQSYNYSQDLRDAEKDIYAAIEFVKQFNHHQVILFGSSYSASLSLLVATKTNRISSVIAFSPGEFFRPEIVVKDELAGMTIPLFAAASEFEYDNVKSILSEVNSEKKFLFKPAKGRGVHGAKALWSSSDSSSEYWLNLTHFFSQL